MLHLSCCRGILQKGGKEVELALLGLQESVELLSAVAQLDVEEVPPQLLEIAALCGRLPVRCNSHRFIC